MKLTKNTNVLVKLSLLSAVAVVLMLIEFPLIPAFPWLKMDLSEVPVIIGAFSFGPLAGIIIEAMKILLNLLINGSQTGGIGELANFIIGVAFVVPASYIYFRNKNIKGAIISLLTGVVFLTIVGVLANYFIFVPLYVKFLPALKDPNYVMNYIMYGVLPFNLIKGVILSAITLISYKKISVLINKEGLGLYKGRGSRKIA